CVDIIRRLEECHNEGFFAKYFGKCNKIKLELNKCLGEEFEIRRLKNAQEAREKRKRVEKLWKELNLE
ncbi:1896_t:CDS:2, partial [Paraglomus brasilianum]